jgi:hypothetical protein
VDTARLDALSSLWQQILPDPTRARVAALVPHLLMIGASVAMPRPTKSDMQDMFALLATRVPQSTEALHQRTPRPESTGESPREMC